jgi:hypothetical protein
MSKVEDTPHTIVFSVDVSVRQSSTLIYLKTLHDEFITRIKASAIDGDEGKFIVAGSWTLDDVDDALAAMVFDLTPTGGSVNIHTVSHHGVRKMSDSLVMGPLRPM